VLLVRTAENPLGGACDIVDGLSAADSARIFKEGIAYAQRLMSGHGHRIQPHVNLSRKDFVDFLCNWSTNLDGITIEVCEGAVSSALIDQLIEKVHHLNGKVAIDDYLSKDWESAWLLRHKWDLVKIDRSFWQFSAGEQQEIVGLLNGHRVCVEGVETSSQFEQSQHFSLAFAQGYWLGKPWIHEGAPTFNLATVHEGAFAI
jgi:EAL domain-containing protein (putative c-di-GMP-specific phosphodiesterase class I)